MKFFKKFSFFWMIIIPLLVPGLFVAIMRCSLRNVAEQNNVFVETVVDLDEFRRLAREEGWSLEELFKKLRENGASSVSISEDTLASLESEGKITVLNTKDIRKLSLNENYEIDLPISSNNIASLWIQSEDDKLLDRITQNLSWKLSEEALHRVDKNLLVINKSSKGILEKVGLGFSNEYFNMANEAGLGTVVRMFNYPGLSADNAYKMINAMPAPASVSSLIFADEEMLGARGDLMHIIQLFKSRSYRIGWIEFDIQDGIKEYLEELSEHRPFVRVHSITRKEMDRVYTADRAVARWVRAVKDRSIKMLYIRCFFQDENKYIAKLTDFNLDYLNNIKKELNKAGYVIAQNDEERINEPRHIVGKPIPAEILAMGISLVLGLAILLKLSFFPEMGGTGALSFTFLGIILFFIFGPRFVEVAGLIGAISYSCIGYVLATNAVEKYYGGFGKCAVKYLFCLVLPSVLGGIMVAGIYSNIEYLLKFEQFRGIKLAFILPLVFAIAWSFRKFGRNIFMLLQKPLNVVNAMVILLVCGSLVLYILRSGNTTLLGSTAIEDSFRTFLENTLIARPRNKEFLIGYPAAMLFVVMLMRRELVMLPLLGLFIQMGQVSVVNTLCHFHTPLKMSLLRIVNGLWIGALIGLAIVTLWRLLQLLITYGKGKQKRVFLVGYFGFGNAGDEFLREIYTNKFMEKFEEYSLSVLIGRGQENYKNDERLEFVLRRDTSAIIEELIRCEALIIPGGGIFQSATSLRSLFYYYLIIWLARKFGTKVVLPAQGLGPWRKGIFSRWLNKKLANELKKAEYLTVRDKASVERYKEITSPEAYVELTSDMAFLNNNFEEKRSTSSIQVMRVCAVLRSSGKRSNKIAEELVKISKENDNIELIPVAFQPEEDSRVWRKAGWKGEIKTADRFEDVFDGADLVFSMRLHGCIVATNMGIPWVGITYDPKVTSFAEYCDWSQFCCTPEKADAEFFEGSINKLAFSYVQCSEKLLSCAKKMHKKALEDFEKSSNTAVKTVAMLFLFLVLSFPTFAQSKFPIWMEEVDFSKKSSNPRLLGPVDPETGAVTSLEPKKSNKFKPNLPSFVEMRKKAAKTQSEGIRIVKEEENGKSFEPTSEVAANTATEATSVALSLKTGEEEPSEEELLKRRTYRPGQIGSFYRELKEAEAKKQEESLK